MTFSTSYKSEYCTKTRTQSCPFPPRECPSHHWEIIWETWRTNCDYIVEFASGGPKNYGYKTHKGKEDCKVRGITHLIVWGRDMSILKSSKTMCWKTRLPHWSLAKHASLPCPYPSKSWGTPKNTNCPPWPNEKNTSWSTTSVWWILTPSKPSRMGMSGGQKRMHTWLNCLLLSNSYSDGHLASSHLILQKEKKKNVNTVNSPSDNESRWLLDDTHPHLS